MSVAMLASASALPYFHLGAIDTGVVPIQAFGILVAAGVLIGASLLRRYAEWHGIPDEEIRGLTGWVAVTGFIGAHVFDVIAYDWPRLANPEVLGYKGPLLLVELWDGISSYGGFIGGALGFAFYVWWKRLPPRLLADITLVGLLPAFSIGRIGCTVVSDHIGAMVDSAQWYAGLAIDYPITYLQGTRIPPHTIDTGDGGTLPEIARLAKEHGLNLTDTSHLLAWNLGLIELLWLIPVNAIVLWLAFRRKRINAGFIVAISGVLYAPVRFFLDFLRPENTDPRYAGLTFAQWASLVAFGAAVYVALRVARHGQPAKTIAPTSREAQEKIKMVLAEDEDEKETRKANKVPNTGAKGASGKKGGAGAKKKAAAAKPAADDDDEVEAPPVKSELPATLGADD